MTTLVLSSDSHVLEPADLWTTRMQEKFRDRAPRLVHENNGRTGDWLVCEGLSPMNPTGLGSAGIPPAELEKFHDGGYAVCRPGSWDPVECLKDMDADGLGVEIVYTGLGMGMFAHPDDEFQRDAHRAFNDWLFEYASYAPKRLLPIANISMTDPVEDLKELKRVKDMGFRGIFISNDPLAERRYDNPMWESFWAACEEYELPINVHILTGQISFFGPPAPGVHRNQIADSVLLLAPSFKAITDMCTGGVFDRHPKLKVISVENDIGWVPNFMKRLEWYSSRFASRYPDLKRNAADYWRDYVYHTFQDDEPGMRCLDMIGVDKVMWGSDYPHFDSTWPNSQEAIERNFAGVSDEERDKILGGNLVEVYGLQDILD